jgi:hypothetical protein
MTVGTMVKHYLVQVHVLLSCTTISYHSPLWLHCTYVAFLPVIITGMTWLYSTYKYWLTPGRAALLSCTTIIWLSCMAALTVGTYVCRYVFFVYIHNMYSESDCTGGTYRGTDTTPPSSTFTLALYDRPLLTSRTTALYDYRYVLLYCPTGS